MVDGGTDNTAGVALDAGVYTCVLPVNLGQGAALKLGYELAAGHGARYVVTLDADGQNDPAELATMVQPLLDDESPTSSSPPAGSGSTRPPTGSARPACTLYASILNAISHQDLTDSSNGYRAFKIELLNDIAPHLIQDQYQTAEVVITASSRGWRITQQPTVWHPRASGTSKKGGNLIFGLQYGRVIGTTWLRVMKENRQRA